VTGYYALIQDLTSGLSIPVYSSLTEQTGETLLFELEPEPEAVIAAIEGDRSAIEDALTQRLTSYAAITAPRLVTEALTGEAAALDRPLTAAEQQEVQNRVVNDFTAELEALVTAQLGGFEDSLDSFAGQLGSYRDKFFAEIDGREYTFFTAKILGEAEGKEALGTVEDIFYTIKVALGTDEFYTSGSSQCVRDLASTTEKDFVIVNALSAALILIILLFTFKDVVTSLLLIVLIELAIFINLSVSALFGTSLNFMSYIVISAIQLGATIDYAILMTKSYRYELQSFGPYEAISRAIKSSAFPIVISMSILFGACLSVYFISSDTIIREITMLIARGALISGIIVLFILPAILALMTTRKSKKKLEE
jgi:multidrug efflux pump subunit AcrB